MMVFIRRPSDRNGRYLVLPSRVYESALTARDVWAFFSRAARGQ
jgi:hypothetical protein